MIHVREMTTYDMQAVVDIDLKSSEFPWSLDEWRIAQREFKVFLVTSFGEPVGFIVFSGEKDEKGNPGVWLRVAAVKPAMRGQGCGRKLAERMMQYAHEIKAKEIRAAIPESHCYDRPCAGSWLLACGFKATEVLRNKFEHYGVLEDGISFTLVL